MPHQGEILQEAIKNSGVSITRIVEELGITRPTMYRKFKDDTLDSKFVTEVGKVIGHDFSNDFTVVQQSLLPFTNNVTRPTVNQAAPIRVTNQHLTDNDLSKQLLALQAKYITLLESYNELLLKVYGPK